MTIEILPLALTDTTGAARGSDDDAADLARAQRVLQDIEDGKGEWLPTEMVDRLMAGENRVRVWREHRGLPISELSRKSGVDRVYLTEIETGKKPGSVAALRGLASALGVQIDDLIPPDAE